MTKVSPIIRSFNAGEFSPLMEGRTDLDRYPASMREMFNAVAAPQGPWIPRSGTEFVNFSYDDATMSVFVPFVFSETDFYMIEFANNRIRFFTETGLLTYAPVAVTAMTTGPFTFTSASLGAAIGDEVAFSNFPSQYNLNGVVGKITNKVGNVYTVSTTFPALATLTTFQVARVYHIASPYSSAQISDIRDTASLDVVYLTRTGTKTYKLQRFDTYNWQFVVVPFEDGPYLATNEEKTTFTPTTTGKATPDMTAASAPSGTASASTETAGFEAWRAFDATEKNTYWQATTNQTGVLQYQFPAGVVVDGYSLQVAVNNVDTSYTSKDYAPSNFTFEGSNNGTTWTVLDTQNNYVLYDNNKSAFFTIPNTTAYTYYRLNITGLTRNGAIPPRVKSLFLRSTASTSITFDASSTTGINNNQGFLATDVGRLVRFRGSDQAWRPFVITARNSATQIVCTLLGEPLPDVRPSSAWRLGAYSDTTGYASYSTFHDDRLYFAATASYPDFLAGSVTGDYENMAPTTSTGEVLATSGISLRLNARRLSKIKWLSSVKDGLALGTGSKEYVLKTAGSNSQSGINPKDGIKAVDSGSRGSSDMAPAEIDSQVLFGQRGGRTLREFAYTYESDGYKSPSMNQLASHLGIAPFVKQAYAAEPFSLDWILRNDGTVVCLTYNRDENVIGWHRHDFNGVVESVAVLPSSDQLRDTLWLIVRRTVGGVQRRCIEKLTRFWDFDMDLDDAHYVDCGLRYSGTAIQRVYGLSHLEGRTDVYGLADHNPVGPFTVTGGYVDLPLAASNIVLGIGFESLGVTSRLENGAQDGTAQGKTKRVHNIALNVWESATGDVGVYNPQTREIEYTPVDYEPEDASQIETIALFSGIVGPFNTAPGYDQDGSLYMRRAKDKPLPFNIVALMPQMVTQDR